MKKIHLLLCLCLGIYFGGYAQTTANNLLIGGNINWSSYNEDGTYNQPYRTDRQDRFMFTCALGKFIQENLAGGVLYRQEFYNSTQKDHNQTPLIAYTSKSNSITVGPFIRKYFVISEQFSLYTQAMLGYSINKNESKENNLEVNTSKFNYLVTNLQPGLAFFVSNKIGLDLTVPGLEYRFRKAKNNDIGHVFSAQFDLPALNLGVSFYLNR